MLATPGARGVIGRGQVETQHPEDRRQEAFSLPQGQVEDEPERQRGFETAEMVTRHGGEGIWAQVDHTDEAQVEKLFARVRQEQHRLDILINDVWGGDELTEWGKPFWELTLSKGLLMLQRAVIAHIITSRHGVPLLVEGGRGLVVEITDGDHVGYRGNLFYDLSKMNAIRLAYAMASDLSLKAREVTAVTVTPGFLRSEMMLDDFGVTEATWRDAVKKDPMFAESETPFYVGRAVAALAADPDVHTKAGGVFASWTLAREYGFRDADGRQPDWGRFFDGVIADLLARGGPLSGYERMVLQMRYLQVHRDTDEDKKEETVKITALLEASGQ